ncbi:MAG: DUF4910 domain-containing protein [Lachnospiraceae bacterium]|nr:DUF4910 domain-containing protein [Lachnospiraceae bacterium]
MSIGNEMYELARELFPIDRSLTGDGVRQTLAILKRELPHLTLHEVPSGTQVFDWTVPQEWAVRQAYIEDEKGNRVVDYKQLNLHVMGYSTPVDRWVELDELKQYIYVQQGQPEAVPYVTSYYTRRYGFCMSERQRDSLKPGKYHMVIDSELFDGSLTYGELILPGTGEKEILISTYVCHPSMANNELSGPVLAVALAKTLAKQSHRKYTYRFIWIPETIGSITYLSQHLADMKKRTVAGFVLSCVGDDRTYSYIPTRKGDTLADRVARNVLSFHYPEYKKYTFLDRGSDERQYNAPGVDLPVCVVCRSKYGEYPEYHTSLDDLSVISPEGLQGAYDVYMSMLNALEHNGFYRIKCLCEPQLGKRGLYPSVSKKGAYDAVKSLVNFIAYADGEKDLIDISNIIGVPISQLIPVIAKLTEADLLECIDA